LRSEGTRKTEFCNAVNDKGTGHSARRKDTTWGFKNGRGCRDLKIIEGRRRTKKKQLWNRRRRLEKCDKGGKLREF